MEQKEWKPIDLNSIPLNANPRDLLREKTASVMQNINQKVNEEIIEVFVRAKPKVEKFRMLVEVKR